MVQNRRFLAKDVGESDLLRLLDGQRAKIIVTVIGGQRYIFGRGNQQISPAVIKQFGKSNIIVVATKDKLANLAAKPLLVDTGDEETNLMLSGYIRVLVGYNDIIMAKVAPKMERRSLCSILHL